MKRVPTEEGVTECCYVPTKPGNYIINVTFADQHISKSPFKVSLFIHLYLPESSIMLSSCHIIG